MRSKSCRIPAATWKQSCCTMATTSADSSGSYEKGQVELSQSSRSSVFDYSEDTFESFSEEEAACCQRESEPPELCCSVEDVESSAVSDGLESKSFLAGQNHTDEQSEVVGSAAVERYFMRKWMEVLKNKEAVIKQGKSVIKTHSVIDTCFVDVWLTEVAEFPDEELDALRSFCTVKVRRMHQGLIPKQASGVRSRKLQHGFTSKKSETSDLNCTVPGQLMNRIRLKNIRETIKQVLVGDKMVMVSVTEQGWDGQLLQPTISPKTRGPAVCQECQDWYCFGQRYLHSYFVLVEGFEYVVTAVITYRCLYP
ncbi:uncharacterized protein C8orf48 homolog isoform X6 [Oxyura jamaicensis]|uniref:uncharacterized protein C8orf48 homolog isoform X6 n=1 Tax=Oxyura jamaicensis TaxID=8884 RepID=UPI0015A68397|nr:uncharacterized protein C8orf48 homolog isoform X6 [Oxyura jamaicensis]